MLTSVSGIWLHLHPSDIPMIPLWSLIFMLSYFLDIHSWYINKNYVHKKNGKHAETSANYFSPFVEIIKNKSLLEVHHSCPTFFYLLP